MTEPAEPPLINLGIGAIHVSNGGEVISTVLGSCVSVCLYDRVVGVAGMNHYMLPSAPEEKMRMVGKFGRTSIPQLLSDMQVRGARPQNITAKIFGGAQVMATLTGFGHIAENNIAEARARLQEAGVKVVAADVGGTHGRKVLFYTDTGRVTVREVQKSEMG